MGTTKEKRGSGCQWTLEERGYQGEDADRLLKRSESKQYSRVDKLLRRSLSVNIVHEALSGICVYGSPFFLIPSLFPSLSAYSNGLHTLYSLFIHPNVPPIVYPVSNLPPSPCDQTCHILIVFIPCPLDDRGPFLFHNHCHERKFYSPRFHKLVKAFVT